MREFLRSLDVFAARPPVFDVDAAPPDPRTLFATWLDEAVTAGTLEPHAMTLSTIGADGAPDARVLIVKDVDAAGWWFATGSGSAKGRQLAAHPMAAATFYWPERGRQVRVRGPVRAGSDEQSARDFNERGVGAKAVALLGQESEPLESRVVAAAAVSAMRERLDAEPELLAPDWRVYVLQATEVEFWQADRHRVHTRLRYDCVGDQWQRSLLWP